MTLRDVKITADTNVLIRLIMADDETQGGLATEIVKSAGLVAISTHALCELAWVLDRTYGISRADIGTAIRGLVETGNVAVNRAAVDAGLNILDAGGDFADGVIAYEGRWLGGDIFVSFDRKAVGLLKERGRDAQHPT